MPLSEALRELLQLDPEDRSVVQSLITPELAADLIEEAPHEMGADLIEALEAARAVEILDEMDFDVQADLIGDTKDEETEAILSKMDAEDAADVRRLAEYKDDTAGGLILTETFQFADTQTADAVVKLLASDAQATVISNLI